MRNIIVALILFSALHVFGVDQKSVDLAVIRASTRQQSEYLAARNTIVGYGKDALPFLAQIANRDDSNWQARLVARICYERVVRSEDIDALRRHNWRAYEPYNPVTESLRAEFGPVEEVKDADGKIIGRTAPLTRKIGEIRWRVKGGPHEDMGQYVVPKCQDTGLWYYFIELLWKNTGEATVEQFDPQFDHAWPQWCRKALKGEPEAYYIPFAMMERLEHDPDIKEDNSVAFYRYLQDGLFADAVPILLRRSMSFTRRTRPPKLSDDELFSAFRWEVNRIIAMANTDHKPLILKFIDSNPPLLPLNSRVTEMQSISNVPKLQEPPFRIGSELVEIK